MSPTDARPLLAYLETLTAQQERDLAGARDRLAILAESDVGHLLDPATGGVQIDLRESLDRGDVVLFRLEADRRPLAAEMLGAAIVQDLVAISNERQHGEQRPGLVIIDEFSAFGAPQTKRLFGRGRGGWLSQLLGTQEMADLGPVDTNVAGGAAGSWPRWPETSKCSFAADRTCRRRRSWLLPLPGLVARGSPPNRRMLRPAVC
jgi:hypothetical protein